MKIMGSMGVASGVGVRERPLLGKIFEIDRKNTGFL
jgi:hypothetical protein